MHSAVEPVIIDVNPSPNNEINVRIDHNSMIPMPWVKLPA